MKMVNRKLRCKILSCALIAIMIFFDTRGMSLTTREPSNLAPETILPTIKKKQVLSLRDPAQLYDPVYGDRMYETTPHRIAIAVVASSPEDAERTLKYLKEEIKRFPPNHKTPIIMLGGLSEDMLEIPAELQSKYGLYLSGNNYSNVMYDFRDKAYNLMNATILTVISDGTNYAPGDIVKNIKTLMDFKRPSVIVSSVEGQSRQKSNSNPVDYTFYTDSHFVRERHAGKSFYDHVSPYLIVNGETGFESPVEVSLRGETPFREGSKWPEIDKSNLPFVPSLGVPGDRMLPQKSKIVFFEPHQDDYALAAGTLLRNLMIHENEIEVITMCSDFSNDHWPKADELRNSENREAFERIYEKVLPYAYGKNIAPIKFRAVSSNRLSTGKTNLECLDSEMQTLVNVLYTLKPDVIVVPAAEDTHRGHVRMRELAFNVARYYVANTGRSLRIFSVPLFSAEEEAYSRANRYVLQTEYDTACKQYVLDSYKSQHEYVKGKSFKKWRKEGLERTGRFLDATRDRALKNVYWIEPFLEEEFVGKAQLIDEIVAIESVNSSSFVLRVWVDDKNYTVVYEKDTGQFQVFKDGERLTRPPMSVLENILEKLLRKISVLDESREMVVERRIETAGEVISPLDWLVKSLGEYKTFEKIPVGEKKASIVALKVLYEKLAAEIEEIKCDTGLMENKVSEADAKIYNRRCKERQKLIIGVASHESHEIISKRLQNIADQIRAFPDAWGHWEIEIVLCINGSPDQINRIAFQTIEQVHKDFFDGIDNPMAIVVLKEIYPNQSNALNVINKYARDCGATMLTVTDDDVVYEEKALSSMIKRLMSIKEKEAFIGSRFFWRRRDKSMLYEDAMAELNRLMITKFIPEWLVLATATVKMYMKMFWQEIVIFRRRVDVPFSPKVILGAAGITWVDNWKDNPYWIRQSDVWWRMRYAPYIEVVDEDGARSSSIAARSFLYYIGKRPRTYYGYRDDIFSIFSERRIAAQNDGDINYDNNARNAMKGEVYMKMRLKDKVYLHLNLLLHDFSDWLYGNFEFIFRSPRFVWVLAERGAEEQVLGPDEKLIDYEALTAGGNSWRMIDIHENRITYHYTGNKGMGLYPRILKHDDVRVSDEGWIKARFKRELEDIRVGEDHFPVISEAKLEGMSMRYPVFPYMINFDVRKRILRVFIDLYAVPDVRAAEIMARRGLSKEELADVYAAIRDNKLFQELFMEHPIYKNFFHRMRGLLSHPEATRNVIEQKAAFPLDIEMHPSVSCNLKCSFCYSYGHMYYKEKRKGEPPLSLKRWETLVNECAEKGLRRIDVVGGLEPLMSPKKTIAIIKLAKKRGLDVKLFTNAVDLDMDNDQLVDGLLGVDQILISLKGASEKTFRSATGRGKKIFKRVINNIKRLAKEKQKRGSKVNIGLVYLVCPENYEALPQLFEFARKNKIDMIGLSTDNVRELSFTPDQAYEMQAIVTGLINKANAHDGIYKDINVALNDFLVEVAYLFDRKEPVPDIYNYELRNPVNCQIWLLRPAINPFGKVHHCCLVSQPGIALMNLGRITADNSLEDIISKNRMEYHNWNKCPSCNPAELSGLRAVEKFALDHAEGISLEMQPYNTEVASPQVKPKAVDEVSLEERAETAIIRGYRGSSPRIGTILQARAIPLVEQSM
ncbi:radical SAM protein [Candidatus Auribacterota bacterium]